MQRNVYDISVVIVDNILIIEIINVKTPGGVAPKIESVLTPFNRGHQNFTLTIAIHNEKASANKRKPFVLFVID